jgi:hypothetical protein
VIEVTITVTEGEINEEKKENIDDTGRDSASRAVE